MLNRKSPQKSIILLIGTNDVGFFGVSYDVALSDYEVLLNQFTEFLEDINKKQKVVLNVMAIFPRGSKQKACAACPGHCDEWNRNNTMFRSINFMNEYLEAFIERQDNDYLRFIDCNGELLQSVSNVAWTDDKGGDHRSITGDIERSIFPDLLHLSAKGYEQWAKCLKQQSK